MTVLASMICAALDGQSIVGLMCDCRSLDLSELVGMPSGIDSGHGKGPTGRNNVNDSACINDMCSIGRSINCWFDV